MPHHERLRGLGFVRVLRPRVDLELRELLAREPRISVSRSVIPITSDVDRRLFGDDRNEDQVGWLDGAISRFGRSYTGEPDRIAAELAEDAAVSAADTILLTVPSQLGVDYNAALLETIARDIAPAIGWNPKTAPEPVG